MDTMILLVAIGSFMALASVVVGVIVLAKGNKAGDSESAEIGRAKLSNKFMRYRVVLQGAVLALLAIAFIASQ